MDEQGLLITPESSAGAPRQVRHCSVGALFQLFPSVGGADLAFPILVGCSFRVRGKQRQHKGGLVAAPRLSPPAKGIPRASRGLPEASPACFTSGETEARPPAGGCRFGDPAQGIAGLSERCQLSAAPQAGPTPGASSPILWGSNIPGREFQDPQLWCSRPRPFGDGDSGPGCGAHPEHGSPGNFPAASNPPKSFRGAQSTLPGLPCSRNGNSRCSQHPRPRSHPAVPSQLQRPLRPVLPGLWSRDANAVPLLIKINPRLINTTSFRAPS